MDQPSLLQPATATGEPAPEVASHGILFGPLGLRAGWGIALFFVVSALLGWLLFTGLFRGTGHMPAFQREMHAQQQALERAKSLHQPAVPPPAPLKTSLLLELTQAGAVLLAAGALSLLERRRFAVYGLGAWPLGDALQGALVGLISLALLVGLLRASHVLAFDARLLHGGAEWRYGLGWLVMFLLVGVFEEFLFRGYLQFTLMRGLLGLGGRISPANPEAAAFWLAALLWSLLFSATHLSNAGEDPFGLIMVFVAGVLFSYALWRTGSLWWGVGFHMTWDWAQSFLFGVPDSGNLSAGRLFQTHPQGKLWLSGGSAGPEGSLLVLPVLALVAVVLRMHKRRPLPSVEPVSMPRASLGSAVGNPHRPIP